jgi:diguanylate cyclase (GGDEF)-like protein
MFVHHWSNHWSTLTPLFRKGIEAGYQSGDLLYLAYSAQDCVIWDPTLDIESAERLHAENIEIVRECAYQDSFDSGSLFLQMQRNLLGQTNSAISLSDQKFDSQKCFEGMQQRQFMTGIANHNIYNAEICFLYGDYDRALQFIKAQDPLIKSAMSLPQLVRYYLVANLTLTTHYPEMSKNEQVKTFARLRIDLARMTRWADNCEVNFRHLQYLMTAELNRIEGKFDLAMQYYDMAIEAAKKSGFLRDEATACERAAFHLMAQGHPKQAEGYIRAAHLIYDRWGAKRKVKWLFKEYPVLHELTGKAYNANKATEISDLDLASVMKASREISGEMVLDLLLQKTMSILLENSGAQWGCLVVRREDKFFVEAAKLPKAGLPTIDVPEHMNLPTSGGERLPLPIALISKIYFSGQALVLHEAALEGPYTRDPYIVAQHARSVLCVPIKRERFEGVLYLENNLAGGVFTEDRVEIIRLLAAQALVAIDNARLYEQVQEYSHTLEAKVAKRTARLEELNEELQNLADRDGLTDVANRRRGDAYLQEVWLRLRREELPLTVIMLDVDYFKVFNDTYGHQAGDDCLIRIASMVQSKLHRVDDFVARYGGEEFILILPNTDCQGALRVGEDIRSAVESLAIEHENSSVSDFVTVSMGSATVVPQQGKNYTTEELVHQADLALYKAKELGRNRIEASTDIPFIALNGEKEISNTSE